MDNERLREISPGVLAMCGGKKCCPTIESDGNFVHIVDDFGGSIKVLHEQISLIQEAVEKLNK